MMLENENVRYLDIVKKMDLVVAGPSSGSLLWKPAGAALYENLRQFILDEHINYGYSQVKSPSLVDSSLFDRSGHSLKYKENMFFVGDMALRPMSCPNHIAIYESSQFSFRDLPVKMFEFGEVFRNEASGSLQMLFRQRQFCQDDSHIFAKADDIKSLIKNYLQMSAKVYQKLGFNDVEYMISLRPEQKFGSEELWDKAESFLKQACDEIDIKYGLEPGGGAFYGPKIELKVKDKLGRYWQLGVIQLDYVLPERFNISYINEEGEKEVPVILHHAVLGSLERMIGILLEVFGGDIPEYLHPVKAVVLPVSIGAKEYGEKFLKELRKREGYKMNECILDSNNLSLQKRIALHSQKFVPNIYVVGEKEAKEFDESGAFKAMLRKNGNNSPFQY